MEKKEYTLEDNPYYQAWLRGDELPPAKNIVEAFAALRGSGIDWDEVHREFQGVPYVPVSA
jgi:hypothetical protein